jgi:hypothetical protein
VKDKPGERFKDVEGSRFVLVFVAPGRESVFKPIRSEILITRRNEYNIQGDA